MRQDSQNRLNAQYAAQDGRPQPSHGGQNQPGQPQYMMHPVQQQQQNHMMAQQQRMMQQGGPRQMIDQNGQGYPQAYGYKLPSPSFDRSTKAHALVC
jgi:hypothetical protein